MIWIMVYSERTAFLSQALGACRKGNSMPLGRRPGRRYATTAQNLRGQIASTVFLEPFRACSLAGFGRPGEIQIGKVLETHREYVNRVP